MNNSVKLPPEFKERMKSLLGKEFDNYILTLNEPNVKGFRVNTNKISAEEFQKINVFGNEKIPYVENGYYLDYQGVGNHPYHHAGLIYVQEPAAMAPAECVEIGEDWLILDMCAAPGGKSTQLKNKLGPNGLLVSNEIIPSRCKILTGNIERLGFLNTVTTCLDSAKIANIFPKTFNLIMVDAPCSGEGMFRKEPNATAEWSVANVEKCAARQLEILENATAALKNGGYIIYATCTFSLEENEMVVNKFLQNHKNFEIVRVPKAIEENSENGIVYDQESTHLQYARRFYPHKVKGEGQFVAVLKNTDSQDNSTQLKTINPFKNSVVSDFLNDTLENYNPNFVKEYNGNPIYFPANFEVKKGTAFSCGVLIGEIRKNYIIPHHQFFMALGGNFKRKIELTLESENLYKYLHGQEIETDAPNGWAVVTVEGATLGGVKVVNGVAKNHYPKGLRINKQ